MLLEAKELWAEAEKAYASFLEENPCDQVIFLTVLCETIFLFFPVQFLFNDGIPL